MTIRKSRENVTMQLEKVRESMTAYHLINPNSSYRVEFRSAQKMTLIQLSLYLLTSYSNQIPICKYCLAFIYQVFKQIFFFFLLSFIMVGVNSLIVEHRLSIKSGSRLVRQKIRRFHLQRQEIIREKVKRLLDVGFIREIQYYLEWLSNVVVVPKKNGK